MKEQGQSDSANDQSQSSTGFLIPYRHDPCSIQDARTTWRTNSSLSLKIIQQGMPHEHAETSHGECPVS
jgi:hypothetical protein